MDFPIAALAPLVLAALAWIAYCLYDLSRSEVRYLPKWAWGLFTIFAVIYFGVAVLTSAEFADLAATDVIFGLPLGFILGIGLIIAGLVITRIYLSKVEG